MQPLPQNNCVFPCYVELYHEDPQKNNTAELKRKQFFRVLRFHVCVRTDRYSAGTECRPAVIPSDGGTGFHVKINS